MLTVSSKTLYESFVSIMSSLHETCKQYVQAIDANPAVHNELVEMGLPKSFLANAERVGRGEMHYKLMLKSGHQFARLRYLPLSEQAKALEAPIEVLCANGDRLLVSVDNLTKQQVEQVMSPSGIRSIPAQKAFLESVKQDILSRQDTGKPVTLPANKAYHLSHGRVVIDRKCTFTKQELLNILKELV